MKKHFLLLSLILIELVLYILILFSNLSHINVICYIAVIVAFLYSLLFSFKTKHYLIALAMLFVLIADLFLVLLGSPNLRPFGMLSFMIVQFLFAIYLFRCDSKNNKLSLVIRLAINVLIITIGLIVLKGNIDFLSIFSIIYLANLLANIVSCGLSIKKHYILLIAFICLLLCDIYTGLVIASGDYLVYKEGGLLNYIVNINFNITWLFDVPFLTLASAFCFLSKE